MLFSSIPFLYYFLPFVLLFYFAAPRKLKNAVLLTASLLFYFYGEQAASVLLLFSAASGYLAGLAIKKHGKSGKGKAALIAVILLNLLLLGFFKYADFFIGNTNALFKTSLPFLHNHLPLGISFFVFQTISYAVDVWRDNSLAEKNPLNFTMYVAMFPQLVAGPIVRYSTVAGDLKNRKHTADRFASGIGRFTIGLGKKVLIANALGQLSSAMLQAAAPTVLSRWLSIFAYVLQIYFDFSGYSDMAIGLARLFGFNFPENFNYPFIADSISDFWRCWHISMGTWFREYVYIPLGGNRVSAAKWVRNIFIVWLCTGFWHGANWNFILWGLYFGILLCLEKLFVGKLLKKLPRLLRHIYTLTLVFFSFVLFYIESLPAMVSHLFGMLGVGGLPLANVESLYSLKSYALLLIIACIGATPLMKNGINTLAQKKPAGTILAVLTPVFYGVLLLVSTAYLVDASFNPFLYFRF